MGAAAYKGKGFKERARVNGERPIGAASCRKQFVMPDPPAGGGWVGEEVGGWVGPVFLPTSGRAAKRQEGKSGRGVCQGLTGRDGGGVSLVEQGENIEWNGGFVRHTFLKNDVMFSRPERWPRVAVRLATCFSMCSRRLLAGCSGPLRPSFVPFSLWVELEKKKELFLSSSGGGCRIFSKQSLNASIICVFMPSKWSKSANMRWVWTPCTGDVAWGVGMGTHTKNCERRAKGGQGTFRSHVAAHRSKVTTHWLHIAAKKKIGPVTEPAFCLCR